MARGEAPTTVAPPYQDISKGIIEGMNEGEFIKGCHFVDNGSIISPEQPTGEGIDLVVGTISAGGPMRLIVLGAVNSKLEELTAQAVSGLYAETYPLPAPSYLATTTQDTLTVGTVAKGSSNLGKQGQETSERKDLEWQRQLERVRELRPHAALIVGTTDNPAGPKPLQEACQLVINAVQELNKYQYGSAPARGDQNNASSRQLPVLYAGAPQFVEAVRRMLGGYTEVTRVETLVSQEQLGPTSVAATALYERDVIHRVPGYNHILSWSRTGPISTVSSLRSLGRFLAPHYTMKATSEHAQ